MVSYKRNANMAECISVWQVLNVLLINYQINVNRLLCLQYSTRQYNTTTTRQVKMHFTIMVQYSMATRQYDLISNK